MSLHHERRTSQNADVHQRISQPGPTLSEGYPDVATCEIQILCDQLRQKNILGASLPLVRRRSVVGAQAGVLGASARSDDKADNEAVQTQRLGENEDQNHTDEEARLLSVGSDTSIADNADGKASSEGAHANGQASSKVSVAEVC